MSADNDGHKLSDEGRRATRRIAFFAYAFLIVSITAMLLQILVNFHFWSRVNEAEKDKPLSVTQHVRIGGVDYDIPKMYLLSNPHKEPSIVSNIHYTYPTMEPLSGDYRHKIIRGKRSQKLDDFKVSVSDSRTQIPFQNIVSSSLDQTWMTVPSGKIYDLTTFDYPQEKEPKKWKVPFVFYKKDGQAQTIILCSEVRQDMADPYCTHTFTDNALNYNIFYKKSNMREWQNIEKKTVALFAEWRARGVEKGYGKIIIGPQQMDNTMREFHQKLNKEK